jgi:hypothetical protein
MHSLYGAFAFLCAEVCGLLVILAQFVGDFSSPKSAKMVKFSTITFHA